MGLLDNLKGFFGMQRSDLGEQEAAPVPNSHRSPWITESLLVGLTPSTLGTIMAQVRTGDLPTEYLALAQEIESRDLHYRSVLSTRKHSIEGLKLSVEAVGDDEKNQAIAEAVRQDIMRHSGIRNLIKNALDALGKGFSVNEIIWDTKGPRWKPQEFLFRDPRWFTYDKTDGRTLLLRSPQGTQTLRLSPLKYVIHEPLLLSGPQIQGGLAYTALTVWLITDPAMIY